MTKHLIQANEMNYVELNNESIITWELVWYDDTEDTFVRENKRETIVNKDE